MNYADIILNDFTAGDGVSLSVFFQGCDRHCKGCHNVATWDFEKGKPFTPEVIDKVVNNIDANGIQRNLAVMGGEPLHPANRWKVLALINNLHHANKFPPIYIWTGYTIEELVAEKDTMLESILCRTDYLIDGPYVEEERDITLKWRGSRNQRIFDKNQILCYYNKKVRGENE